MEHNWRCRCGRCNGEPPDYERDDFIDVGAIMNDYYNEEEAYWRKVGDDMMANWTWCECNPGFLPITSEGIGCAKCENTGWVEINT